MTSTYAIYGCALCHAQTHSSPGSHLIVTEIEHAVRFSEAVRAARRDQVQHVEIEIFDLRRPQM